MPSSEGLFSAIVQGKSFARFMQVHSDKKQFLNHFIWVREIFHGFIDTGSLEGKFSQDSLHLMMRIFHGQRLNFYEKIP